MGARVQALPDGRWHLNHGPIDVILTVDGPGAAAGRSRALARFEGLLEELVAELPLLRAATKPEILPAGPVARAMWASTLPFRPAFITPMAAVAGAVAEALVLAARGPGVTRIIANNGGDIALWLAPGERATAVLAAAADTRVTLAATDGIGGIATSGWRGRSHSLGIADAVTVLADTAPAADAAATMIANALDLPGHPAVTRIPARTLAPDSDLGTRPVTVAVGPLSPDEVARALDNGLAEARRLAHAGLLRAAHLTLAGQTRTCDTAAHFLPRTETADA